MATIKRITLKRLNLKCTKCSHEDISDPSNVESCIKGCCMYFLCISCGEIVKMKNPEYKEEKHAVAV